MMVVKQMVFDMVCKGKPLSEDNGLHNRALLIDYPEEGDSTNEDIYLAAELGGSGQVIMLEAARTTQPDL